MLGIAKYRCHFGAFFISAQVGLTNQRNGALYFVVCCVHYSDVRMGAIASQFTSLTIVFSTVYSDADHRKHQSPTSLAFERGTRRWPVNSPHKGPRTRKMFPFHDVIMILCCLLNDFCELHLFTTLCLFHASQWRSDANHQQLVSLSGWYQRKHQSPILPAYCGESTGGPWTTHKQQ